MTQSGGVENTFFSVALLKKFPKKCVCVWGGGGSPSAGPAYVTPLIRIRNPQPIHQRKAYEII